jgi:hypothetical protein
VYAKRPAHTSASRIRHVQVLVSSKNVQSAAARYSTDRGKQEEGAEGSQVLLRGGGTREAERGVNQDKTCANATHEENAHVVLTHPMNHHPI